MTYKLKYEKDGGRPYTVRKTFPSISDAQDYAEDAQMNSDAVELYYEVIDESGNVVHAGCFCG